MVLDADRLTDSAGPEVAAGWVALAAEVPMQSSGLHRHLRGLSLTDALTFAGSGHIREYDLWEVTRLTGAVQAPLPAGATDRARKRLAAVNLPVAPVSAIEATLQDAGQRPTSSRQSFQAPISGQDWMALKNFCGG